MERWVAIILALLIVVIAFFVVKRIADASNDLPDATGSAECVLNSGVCKPLADCIDGTIKEGIACPEQEGVESGCCVKDK